MTQADIQAYYSEHWGEVNSKFSSQTEGALAYSSPIEDAVLYPIYRRLIQDLGIRVDGGRVLDIGCGAGRWVRFFTEHFSPSSLTGVDFAESSIELLREWSKTNETSTQLNFVAGDITAEQSPIEGSFDLINIANVLFHIPEADKYDRAMSNLSRLLADGGRIVTTEYLPRSSMRTQWMYVRSRYEFQDACERVGLEIADIRPCSFFSNDPMGVDGPDQNTRQEFNAVRGLTNQLMGSANNQQSLDFITGLFAQVERACLAYCNERIAPVDMPAQKLVVLRKR